MSATAIEARIPLKDEFEKLARSLEQAVEQPAEPPVAQLPGGERRWTCGCGERYRISGSGRHRIYWLLGAPPSDPVTDGCCARCGATLPGKHAHCGRGSRAA